MIANRRLLAVAVAACAALVLGACGAPAATPTERTAPVGATGDPVPGGSARILTLAEPRTLDPAVLGNAYAQNATLGNALFGTLMTNDEVTGEIAYKMAESFDTNDNGATFELKLRDELKFSDGTPLDATAVKFNWDRIKDPANRSPYIFEAGAVGAADVVDARTLHLTMTAPAPNFAQSVVGSGLNWIASPTALQAGQQAFDANPIGAGPFTLKSWTRQDAIELVKNPNYWDAPKPYLDSITLRASQDATQRLNSVISGGADVAVESSWDNLAKATDAGLATNVMPLNGGIYMALNQRRAPFDDIRARQAVAAAIDSNALNAAVYNGNGELADTLFDKTSPLFTDTPLRTQDKATAQRLFDELAAEGKPVKFTFSSFPTTENRAMAESVQAQLSAFNNVTVEVAIVDLANAAALQTSHDYDAIVSGAFFQDPDPTLWRVFSSTSPVNASGVNDPAIDQSLQQGRVATTVEERKASYAALQQRIAELAPVVFIARAAPGAVFASNVGGVTLYGTGSMLPEEIWIKK